MLIPNTLFRMGGAAIVLTNRPALARRAKYRIEHIVRTITAADDASYRQVATPHLAMSRLQASLNNAKVFVP